MAGAGQGRGRAQQVMRDGRADRPRRVGAEASRRYVGQRSVDEVGEGGFDDRVAAVGVIGVGGRLGGVGEKRVIPPDREQAVGGLVGVFDAAPDPAGGDLPARSRIPVTSGGAVSVLMVVTSGESPLRRTCLPAILVCPKEAPCLWCP